MTSDSHAHLAIGSETQDMSRNLPINFLPDRVRSIIYIVGFMERMYTSQHSVEFTVFVDRG